MNIQVKHSNFIAFEDQTKNSNNVSLRSLDCSLSVQHKSLSARSVYALHSTETKHIKNITKAKFLTPHYI